MAASQVATALLVAPQPGVASRSEAPQPRVHTLFRCPTHGASCSLHALGLPCGAKHDGAFAGAEFTRKRVKRAESLYRAGGICDSLYAVCNGFFKSSVMLEDGRGQVTGFHMHGEVLGMDGIGTGSHAAEAIALEDSEVSIIPAARLQEPTLQRQLQKVMSRELVRAQAVMMMLGTLRAEERLAAFLLNLSQRFVEGGLSSNEFRLRMTREEIGSYIGLSLETVSRLFSRFQDDGHIAVRQKHVRILDVSGLTAVMLRIDD